MIKYLLLLFFLLASPLTVHCQEVDEACKASDFKGPGYGPERCRSDNQLNKNDSKDLEIHSPLTTDIGVAAKEDEIRDKTLGKDFEFNMGNPYCAAYFWGNWILFKTAIIKAANDCGVTYNSSALYFSPVADMVNFVKIGFKALSQSLTPSMPSACQISASACTAASLSPILQGAIIANSAKRALNDIRVCGYNWSKNIDTDDLIFPSHCTDRGKKTYFQCLAEEGERRNDREKREWLNEGREFILQRSLNYGIYNLNPISQDTITIGMIPIDMTQVFNTSISRSRNIFTNEINEECEDIDKKDIKFYLRGLDPGNFNCSQFPEGSRSRRCCNTIAKDYICLENIKTEDHRFTFCKKGSICHFPGYGEFSIKELEEGRVLCAESHSFCPYNFSVGGGSIYPARKKISDPTSSSALKIKNAFFDQENASDETVYESAEDLPCKDSESQDELTCIAKDDGGKLINSQQYYAHCTITSGTAYTIKDRKFSKYFSQACIDLKGDSKNTNEIELDTKKILNISAPIAQCFYETFGNIFTGRNGHTICPTNYTLAIEAGQEVCKVGNITVKPIYQKGDPVKDVNGNDFNIFIDIQNNLRFVIKIAMTLSLVFFAIKILMGNADIKKRQEIILLIVKIAIVSYFAIGDAWKEKFFDGVYGAMPELISSFFLYEDMEISSDTSSETGIVVKQKIGICNFNTDAYINENIGLNQSYLRNIGYLRIFDTLDCKLQHYLSFTPGLSTGNIVALIAGSLLTGMYGFLFGLSLFFFAFMLISAIIRALYIFVVSSFVLIIYVFVSPIIFPLILFEKTKNIFNRWLMHMLAFSLQPILMFAYISIFLNATDYLIFGKDPVFVDREISCKEDSIKNGHLSKNTDNKRLACLLRFKDFKKGGSLAIFGVFIPMAKMLFSLDLLIVVIKAMIGIYLLLQMFSLIPNLISAIFGVSIDNHHGDAKNMFLDFVSKLRFMQKHTASIAWQKGFGAGKNLKNAYDELKTDQKASTDQNSGGAF